MQFVLFLAVLVLVARVSRNETGAEGESFQFAPRIAAVPERLRNIWWVKRLPQLVAVLTLLVALVLPFLSDKSERHQTWATIIAFALCAISVVVLTGWGGQLSLGQMAFAGLGALTAACPDPGPAVQHRVARHPVPRRRAPEHLLPVGAPARRGLRQSRRGDRRHRGLARPRAVARDQHAGVRDRGAGLHLQPSHLHRRQHHDRDPTHGPRSARAHPPQPRVLLLRACSCSSSCLVLVSHLKRTGIGRMIVGVRENELATSAMTVSPARAKLHRVRDGRVHRRPRAGSSWAR